jgi:two-component system sensor kinase FixL
MSVPISAMRLLRLGLAVGIGYYAGAVLGLLLKLPNATPSVVWPPNAILTAALLLSPPRLWPFALASALPAHIVLERAAGWPLPLVLTLFLTNCSEAVIGATIVHIWSDEPRKFDTLRRVAIFIVGAALIAPFVSSFPDAAAVTVFQQEQFWRVWSSRLFSNILTELTLVPGLVTLVMYGGAWLRGGWRRRHLEATLLGGSLAFVAAMLLRAPGPHPIATELSQHATFAFLMPLLLWAAFRFGPGGTSVALVATTFLLVTSALYSNGPFRGLSPAETTLALQLVLIVVSLPLLVVAALVEERRVVQQELSSSLAFEALLAQLAAMFVHPPTDRMESVFVDSLRRIGRFLGFETVMLLWGSDGPREAKPLALWAERGCEPVADVLAGVDFASAFQRSRDADPILLQTVVLPASSIAGEARVAGQPAEFSALAVRLFEGTSELGVLACASRRPMDNVRSPLMGRIHQLGLVFANALARKRTEDTVRASEAMKSAILSSLSAGVVVLDRHGHIVDTNQRWRAIVGGRPGATQSGADYIEYVRSSTGGGGTHPSGAAAGIKAVAGGQRRDFRLEHAYQSPSGTQWFSIRAVPLDHPEGGAVVTYTDVSKQKRAELQVQRARSELAHVSRVSTMGALTASIAHQLNQPLTGIMTNAQAAQRLLTAAPLDLEEVRASLGDIVDDSRRVADVIYRVRNFLRKDSSAVDDVDLNDIVTDVASLLDSDAIGRNTSLVLKPCSQPLMVRGDRVQLEQVVLNVLMNSIDAVGEQQSGTREVVVTCMASDESAEVSVSDCGPGFEPDAIRSVFDPFYTTKPRGMGLGLFIARSIVEAHAGSIGVANNAGGGATVSFRLPVTRNQDR